MLEPALTSGVELPPIAQIGFVVADLERELPRFRGLYGDFVLRRFLNKDCWYRGAVGDCVVDVAYGLSGELEIEIIQPVSGAGPHREFLDRGGHGLHHLQHRAADIDPYVEALSAQGFECTWRMPRKRGATVVYMVRDDYPLVVELVEPLVRPRRGRSSALSAAENSGGADV